MKSAADGSEKPEDGVEDVLLDAGEVQQALDVLTQRPLHGSEEGERVEGVVELQPARLMYIISVQLSRVTPSTSTRHRYR